MGSMFRRFVVPAALFASLHFSARAQGVVPRSIDLSFNGGATNEQGIQGKEGHAMYGGAAAYNLGRHLAVGAEYSYVRLGTAPSQFLPESAHTQLFGGAVRYTLINTRWLVPYVVAGGGGDWLSVHVSGDAENISATEAGGYASVGAGTSLYMWHGFGVRPEFRYNRQEYGSTTLAGNAMPGMSENDLRVTAAIFYQFGGRRRR
jgi:hypothetical protein